MSGRSEVTRRAAAPPACVTLVTDFGTADGYVGAMKGVILSLCPDARIHDITHEVPTGDVRAGAFALETAAVYFPPGTIHVAVVDPGVGTGRLPLLVEAADAAFVGPDNGLLSLAARPPRRIYHLDRSAYFRPEVSNTFHGRDVFASVAGHLAAGTSAATMATDIGEMIEVDLPAARAEGADISGEVVHVDRFGNLLTNILDEHVRAVGSDLAVEIAGRRIVGLSATYADLADGTPGALIGSSGRLEIAARETPAADLLGNAAGEGCPVRIVGCEPAKRG